MSLQRPLHSPPKAEHSLFVPQKELNPSPPRETQSQKPKAIPGYRGFIRGAQHYYGLTDGEVSRRAPSHNFAPTPAGNPHEEAGPRVATESLDSAAPARVLGYSGHIPGRVTRYAETFGRTVENSFAEHRKSASPSKHRIVSTSTTEMPSGTNTIVLDKDEVRFREARALGKTLALRHELEASPGYTGCIRGAQHFFGSTFARVQKEAKTIYPQKGILSGTDTERSPRDRINGYTGHLPGEKSAYGSTFGRTCGDCLDEFQASVSKTAAAGYRILPLAEFSAATPIKRE
jgi:hypothetical protein